MRLRLGRVRYINCEPVYYALERGIVTADCEIHDGTPAELNERLRVGDLDVSVISVMEAALRPEAYCLLPDLAIACDGSVESVLLASERPVEELDGLAVALSPHSLTSVYLVRLLLEKAYHVRPRYLTDASGAGAAARLLIGAEALRLGPRSPHPLDLARPGTRRRVCPSSLPCGRCDAPCGWRPRKRSGRSIGRCSRQRRTPAPTRRRWLPWPAIGLA